VVLPPIRLGWNEHLGSVVSVRDHRSDLPSNYQLQLQAKKRLHFLQIVLHIFPLIRSSTIQLVKMVSAWYWMLESKVNDCAILLVLFSPVDLSAILWSQVILRLNHLISVLRFPSLAKEASTKRTSESKTDCCNRRNSIFSSALSFHNYCCCRLLPILLNLAATER